MTENRERYYKKLRDHKSNSKFHSNQSQHLNYQTHYVAENLEYHEIHASQM